MGEAKVFRLVSLGGSRGCWGVLKVSYFYIRVLSRVMICSSLWKHKGLRRRYLPYRL